VATLSYAYAESIVWLEELVVEAHPMVHDLCSSHASTVRVPRGWELRDRWSDAQQSGDGLAGDGFGGQGRLDLVGA
jgi:hypothetical protein